MKTYRILVLMLTLAIVVGACSLPSSAPPTEQTNPNAIFTAAAQTVVAQLTQNALLNPTSAPATAVPATETAAPMAATSTPAPIAPLPTAVNPPAAVPTTSCDAAQFVTDVTIPDGTTETAKATFVKTWRLKNIGTCTWNASYSLVFDSGNSMGGPATQPLTGTVAPGASVDISVNLQAPAADGAYRGFWGLSNGSGSRLSISGGKTFYVDIKVGSGAASGGTTTGKFAVTSVNFTVTHSGACGSGKYTVTANITTNKEGSVTYYWIRKDGATDTATHSPLNFTKADTMSVSTEWSAGATNLWMDLYIDNPNHQQFGRANLNCP
jgi:hypothetical protein